MKRLVVVGLLALALPARADAPTPTARCTLRIIEARHDGGGIDPQIVSLKPFFEREPFDDWKSFKLLKTKTTLLAPHASDTEALPNAHTATLTYVEHLLGPDGKHRVKLQLEILHGARKDLNTVFTLDEGKPLPVALQKKQTAATEMLILGISCEIPH
jgi:hypothetical protein